MGKTEAADITQPHLLLKFAQCRTAFQLRVWQALREIPRGETRTYSHLAREMGIPKSTRAVARWILLGGSIWF